MMQTLLLPLQFDFMVQALAISVAVAIPMALLSCFLVLKGWSLMGDAISHAVFPGVVLAYMLGLPYALGAFVAGIFCALASGFLQENSRIKQDTVMGVVFAGMFGIGLVLYVHIQADVHLDHILFGDMLGVAWSDVLETCAIAALVLALMGAKWKEFLLYVFDPAQAHAVGLRTRWLHYGLLSLISLAVVGALKAVGIVMAVALLIAPGATAFLLTRRFGAMLLTSVAIAVTASGLGVYAAFFLDSAPAPTIVLTLTMQFMFAFVIAHRRAKRRQSHASVV